MGSLATMRFAVPPTYVDVIAEGQLVDKVNNEGWKFEPETLRAWGRLCKKGSEVLDVGSHTGIFAIAAAKLGARPVAIEPLPFLVERIKENAKLNNVEFRIFQAAASDENGEAIIGYMPHIHHPYGASLLRKDKPHHERLTVKTLTLDSLKMSKVSVMKIDVERCELMVLRGASKLLKRERPAIILEVLNERAFDKTTTFLMRFGYSLNMKLDRRNILMTAR